MPILIGLFTVFAGVLTTVQSGANATLNKSLDQPIVAALVVVATNLVVYLAVAPFVGLSWPGSDRIAQTPWWAWMGGLFGGIYVLSAIFFAERLGAAIFTGLTVTAGIVTSIALDHFGLIGFQQHSAGLWRILGGAVMIGGLLLVSFT
ncbi:DMT family transporter [Lichenibacterium minor]|uniref:DMT family transporter n=1 Tax=Lichenibacterium minor TaxID=2316528 RepID=A0A4Q2TYZ1_9HYPH|nr:DMT family transporter [Lichenibacterium minor]RYC28940.1 DMT family transporter [Lichenibacterium minor]